MFLLLLWDDLVPMPKDLNIGAPYSKSPRQADT
jgi:hypothetical protein